MVGPLPNLHVVKTSPPIFLRFYLLKSIVHLCCSSPALIGLVCFLFCILRPVPHSFPRNDGSKPLFLSWSPWPRILKWHFSISAQPLATNNFIYQSNTTGNRDPQCLTCGLSYNFENPINIIQALDQIYNRWPYQLSYRFWCLNFYKLIHLHKKLISAFLLLIYTYL